jgi:hypothetical protein
VWPSFVAYLLSFGSILIAWAGHRGAEKATIQMFVGLVIYAGTTVLSYWFPITGFIIIFSAQALWIIDEDEKLT